MTEKEDLQSIISELKKILSDSKKEEKPPSQLTEEISSPSSVEPQVAGELKPSEITPDLKIPETYAQTPEFPSITTSLEEMEISPEVKIPEVPDMPPSTVESPGVVETPIAVESEQPPVLTSAEVLPPAKEQVPSENLLQIALLYPIDKPELKDKFVNNLFEVAKRTSKKPFEVKIALQQEVDLSSIHSLASQLDENIKDFVRKKINAVVLISPENFKTNTIQEKFSSAGLYFQSISFEKLDKKITYLDILIELMLQKE